MSRIEDVLGAVGLFLMLFGGFWLMAGLGWPTGACELIEVMP